MVNLVSPPHDPTQPYDYKQYLPQMDLINAFNNIKIVIFTLQDLQTTDFSKSLRNDDEGEAHSMEVLFLFAGLGWYYVLLKEEYVPASAFVSF